MIPPETSNAYFALGYFTVGVILLGVILYFANRARALRAEIRELEALRDEENAERR